MHDAKHGYVGLSRSRGSANEHILATEQGCVAHSALHSVEAVHALEGCLGPLGELFDGTQLLARLEGLGLEVWDMDHIVPLVRGPGGRRSSPGNKYDFEARKKLILEG